MSLQDRRTRLRAMLGTFERNGGDASPAFRPKKVDWLQLVDRRCVIRIVEGLVYLVDDSQQLYAVATVKHWRDLAEVQVLRSELMNTASVPPLSNAEQMRAQAETRYRQNAAGVTEPRDADQPPGEA